MWRRFTTGSFGSLSAKQYSEVQDAVAALASHASVSTATSGQANRWPMLVRITARYGTSEIGSPQYGEGTQVIGASAYLFEQVHVRLNRENGTVEIAARDYGLKSRQREGQDEDLTLIAIDPRPYSDLPVNTLATVYPIAVDAGPSGNSVTSQQNLYMLIDAMSVPTVGVYEITGTGTQAGHYLGRPIPGAGPGGSGGGGGSADPVPIVNLYETQDYYGALMGTIECSDLTAGTLAVGDHVFVINFGGTLYTMTPVRFDVSCVPCNPTQGISGSQQESRSIEMASAGIMLRG